MCQIMEGFFEDILMQEAILIKRRLDAFINIIISLSDSHGQLAQ